MLGLLSIAAAGLVLGLHPGAARAQSRDGGVTPAPIKATAKPEPDALFHHRGRRDDGDGPPHEALRTPIGSRGGLGLDRSGPTGSGLDPALFPEELGPAPAPPVPPFGQPATDLAIRPDPWEVPPK